MSNLLFTSTILSLLAATVSAGPIAIPTPASTIAWPTKTPHLPGLSSAALPTEAPGKLPNVADFIASGLAVDATDIRNAASAYAAIFTSATISTEAPLYTAIEDVINVVENVYLPQQSNGRGNPLRGKMDLPSYDGSFPKDLDSFDGLDKDSADEPQSIQDAEKDLNPLIKAIVKPAIDGLVTIFDDALAFVLNGISYKYNSGIIGSVAGVTNSFNNTNTRQPHIRIYPKKWDNDAPYSVPEKYLREAIYFPPGYTYGEKKPVILFPGTGSTGGDTFAGNLIPLMQGGEFDLVYVNVPGYMLDDAQVNAEYAAYAMNYVSAVSGCRPLAVVSWSQGGLSNQWALKYWPSTREIVEDFIPVSPDFKGTVMAYYLCPGFPVIPCDPSILQQEYYSNFVRTLRVNGGDSAYVPTTSIYSPIFDEIVEPQTGNGASAYLLDKRNVGVTNNAFASICPFEPAGFASHEGALYNPLTYALVIDALTHDGPGQIDRLNLDELCLFFAAQGLSAVDVAATEGLIPQALINILLYFPKFLVEPPIMPYARKDERDAGVANDDGKDEGEIDGPDLTNEGPDSNGLDLPSLSDISGTSDDNGEDSKDGGEASVPGVQDTSDDNNEDSKDGGELNIPDLTDGGDEEQGEGESEGSLPALVDGEQDAGDVSLPGSNNGGENDGEDLPIGSEQSDEDNGQPGQVGVVEDVMDKFGKVMRLVKLWS